MSRAGVSPSQRWLPGLYPADACESPNEIAPIPGWPLGARYAHRLDVAQEALDAEVSRVRADHAARIKKTIGSKTYVEASAEQALEQSTRARQGSGGAKKPSVQPCGSALVTHRDGVRLCSRSCGRPARPPRAEKGRWRWCDICENERRQKMAAGRRAKRTAERA